MPGFFYVYTREELMPVWKPCPRCKTLIPQGSYYCKDCKPIADAEKEAAQARKAELRRKRYNKAYNQKRSQDDPKYRAFRNSKAWKMTSKGKLASIGYRCEARVSPDCTGIACEVHHIKPIRTPEGWDKRLEWENLMGVCIQCHNILDGKNFKRKKNDGVIDMRTLEM